MMTVAWVFIFCGVWSILMGVMLVSCYLEDISEAEYYALENGQWQRDQDELENE